MKRSVLLVVGATITLLLAGLATFGVGRSTDRPSVEEIGAHVDEHAQLRNTAFIPNVSDERAVAVAREFVKSKMYVPTADELLVRTTVGTFTGDWEGPKGFVSDLKVRVIVFHDFPAWPAGASGLNVRLVNPRFTLILDDATGEKVYGITHWDIAGRP